MPIDLRQHLALERTLLAYVRTGLALMGVGFVVARFGLLLRELGRLGSPEHPGLSLWFGTTLVLVGGLVGPAAAGDYIRQLRRVNVAMEVQETPAWLAVCISVAMAVIGVVMAIYLMVSGR